MGPGTNPAARAPSNLGRYQIVEEIGRGGMGIVYRALDPTIGRTVAIKTILLSGQGSEEQALARRARLLRESQAAGQLSHPNIVAVYDVGEQGDTTYIVMEYIVGQSLEQSMAAAPGPRSAAESIAILADCARALDYAHSKGVVHRDIKPGNIILQPDGVVKIADFGIAKVMESSTLTQTAAVIGSPHFMAPEQLKGEAVSGRTDQYALAVVAYALLTGKLPFDADSMATLVTKTLYQDPPPVPSLNPAVDVSGDGVLRKALAKTPDARYNSCLEFVAALRAATQYGSASTTATIVMPQAAVTAPAPPATPTPPPPPALPPVRSALPPRAPSPLPTRARRGKRLWPLWVAIGLFFALRGFFPDSKNHSDKAETAYWSAIQNLKNSAVFEAYLKKFPEGRHADEARAEIDALKAAQDDEAAASPTTTGKGSSPVPGAPEAVRPAAAEAAGTPASALPPPVAAPPEPAAVHATATASQLPAPACKAEFAVVDADKFQPCLDYWSGKGYSPLTFATVRETDGTVTLTGAFQESGANKITLLQPPGKRAADLAGFKRQNYRPDSVSVLRGSEGPRFTTIWTPAQGSFESYGGLDKAELDAKLQQHTSDGLAITDVVSFGQKDALRFSAIWSRTEAPTRAVLNLTHVDLRQQFVQMQQEGYVLDRVSEYPTEAGARYAAIFRKRDGKAMFFLLMTAFDLQIRQAEAVSKGMRLHYITHSGSRFSAVWWK